MKKLLYILLTVVLLSGCTNEEKTIENIEYDKPTEILSTMRLNISGKDYIVNLEENDAAQLLVTYLPQEYKMHEKNRNEKYAYLSFKLPMFEEVTDIEKGDIMLYENNCLILFYKSFKTNKKYTKIGHIDNLPTLGNDDIVVRFYK